MEEISERTLNNNGSGENEPQSKIAPSEKKGVALCAVRLRPGRPPVHCDTGDISFEDGEWLAVRMEYGLEIGVAVGTAQKTFLKADVVLPVVERLASTREIELYYQNLEQEQNARRICQDLIDDLGLKMKLVRVERLYECGKIIFYYSADGRVDFRELVKQLVSALQTRVEMKQIGIRHEARMIGGMGNCGRELCCTLFLDNFAPVSIKMAKAQNLPLNPNKISGFCGRLLCCLTYEYETYQNIASELPSPGKQCDTPCGRGRVTRVDILQQKVSVALEDGELAEFTHAELVGKVLSETVPHGKRKSVVNPSEWQPEWPGRDVEHSEESHNKRERNVAPSDSKETVRKAGRGKRRKKRKKRPSKKQKNVKSSSNRKRGSRDGK